MLSKKQNITIIGDGGWGTTLSVHLAKQNHSVTLWGPFADYIQAINKTRYNSKFLPGIRIPENIIVIHNLREALTKSDLIIFAIPSKFATKVLQDIRKTKIDLSQKIFLSVTKGIENQKLLRISEMVKKELGSKITFAVLSGPNIAREVALGIPSTAVVACKNTKTARIIQETFNSATFRVYTNTDIIGVELGGSIKNIIAIACGLCDGLGFGSNTKAAILTRGLAEMARLGRALGAQTKTFTGLSGLGDLVTTCFSSQSRNRSVGELLAKGKNIQQITSHMEMVAEGVETVKAAYQLSLKHHVQMPITTEIYNIIYNNKKPLQAVSDLMTRKMKSE